MKGYLDTAEGTAATALESAKTAVIGAAQKISGDPNDRNNHAGEQGGMSSQTSRQRNLYS